MNQTTRAQGCLLGQLAGDALGGMVEFQSPDAIRRSYPDGVRELADGGHWNTLAGQPTDDSEMALALARMLVARGSYSQAAARNTYIRWLDSRPFDCGNTVSAGLRGMPNKESQANGALMRISPLGIFGSRFDFQLVIDWARADAMITHPHPVCLQANALYVMAISYAVKTGISSEELYNKVVAWAEKLHVDETLINVIQQAADSPPEDYVRQMGWLLIAFRNALWQLLYAPSLEEAVVNTVKRGGDTDTNAAICGALLGAVYGREAIPSQWSKAVLSCRPEVGQPGVHRPRPKIYWPVDALELAENLIKG